MNTVPIDLRVAEADSILLGRCDSARVALAVSDAGIRSSLCTLLDDIGPVTAGAHPDAADEANYPLLILTDAAPGLLPACAGGERLRSDAAGSSPSIVYVRARAAVEPPSEAGCDFLYVPCSQAVLRARVATQVELRKLRAKAAADSERERMLAALAEANRQKDALFQLSHALQRAGSSEAIYDAALDAILAALRCDRAAILLFDSHAVMQFVASRGLSPAYRQAVTGHSPWAVGAVDPLPVCIADVEQAPIDAALKATILAEGIRAVAFIPLLAEGKLIGKFMAYVDRAGEFTDDAVALSLTIARQLAFAIERQRNDQMLRGVLGGITDAFQVMDADARFTHFNSVAREMYREHGIDAEALIGVPLWEALPVEVESVARQAFRKTLAERCPTSVESYFDSWKRWFAVRNFPTPDGGVATFLADITERKKSEEMLREREAQLALELNDTRLLQRLSAEMSQEADAASLFEKVVDAATAIMHSDFASMQRFHPQRGVKGELELLAFRGFDPEAAKFWKWVRADSGCTCGEVLKTGQRQIAADVETCAFMAGTPDLVAYRNAGMAAAQSTPLFSRSGALVGMLSTHWRTPHQPSERDLRLLDILARQAADLIDRHAAHESLRRREERMRSLALVLTDVAWSMGPRGEFAVPQTPWQSYTGQSWREHQEFGWFNAMHPDDREAARGRWNLALTCATPCEMHVRLWHAHSRAYRHCVIRATPLFSTEGGVREWVAACTDVNTEFLARTALTEAARRKDEFLATLSHELRNPLAPIRQAARLLQSPGLPERDSRWARDVIDRQVRSMSLLLDDLLDLSRISRGKLELRKAPIELASVVEAAVETARPLLDTKRHELRIQLPAAPVRFEADPLRMAQVLSNLLTNAAKYTDTGGEIVLWAKVEKEILVIGVRDNGIGLSAETLPTVFEMFSQAAPALARSEGGLGIGLALVRGFVSLHGGTVHAESAGEGQGSQFIVRLPLLLPLEEATKRQAEVPAPIVALKILIADDNRDAAETLATLFRMQGHTVRAVYDGRAAVESAESFRPDVLILDIGMPQLNGYDTVQAVRMKEWARHTTCVALTGWGKEEDIRRARDAGFNHHLSKPVEFDQLQALLAAHLPRGS